MNRLSAEDWSVLGTLDEGAGAGLRDELRAAIDRALDIVREHQAMTSVFLATSGSYSDYNVIGVFSTQEAAEQCPGRDEVEECVLDPGVDERRAGLTCYSVSMQSNGHVHSARRHDVPEPRDDYLQPSGEHAEFRMWARDRDHAIKIANERRTAAILAGRMRTT